MENDDEGSTQGKYSWKRATDKRGEWKVVEGTDNNYYKLC